SARVNIARLSRGSGRLYSNRRLIEATEARGHDIQVVHTLRCYMDIASHDPSVLLGGRELPFFDAVIARIGASVTFYGCAVLRQFEMMGSYPLNESVAITRPRDKLRGYMDIASHDPSVHLSGRELPFFDAVIPSIGASVTFYGCSVLRPFEMMGSYPLNESLAITRSRDKLRSLQILARAGIGLP